MPKCTQAVAAIYLHQEFKHDSLKTMEETAHGHNVMHFKKFMQKSTILKLPNIYFLIYKSMIFIKSTIFSVIIISFIQ